MHALAWRIKREHDHVFRNAGGHKIIHNARLGAVVLNPDFPVRLNVNVNHTAVYAADTIKAFYFLMRDS